MTDFERQALQQADHIAAGLGEAPSFEDMLDRINERAVKARMQVIIAAGQSPNGGFLGTGSYGSSLSRSAGYDRSR